MKIGSILLLILLSCLIGKVWGSHGIATYHVTKGIERRPVSFNLDWPTYGLPLAEYEFILSGIQTGDCKEVLPYAEAMLDLTLYDAIQRRQILDGQDRDSLDTAIARAASYRKRYPRTTSGATDADAVAKIKAEVDSFLSRFIQHRNL